MAALGRISRCIVSDMHLSIATPSYFKYNVDSREKDKKHPYYYVSLFGSVWQFYTQYNAKDKRNMRWFWIAILGRNIRPSLGNPKLIYKAQGCDSMPDLSSIMGSLPEKTPR